MKYLASCSLLLWGSALAGPIYTAPPGSGSGVTTMGSFGSSPNNNGGTISGTTLTLQPADSTHPGGVSTASQFFAGAKSFLDTLTISKTSNGSTDHLLFLNPSGNLTTQRWKFGSTEVATLGIDSSAEWAFHTASDSSSYLFYTGPSLASQNLSVLLDGNGVLSEANVVAFGRVVAGAADASSPATLNAYGSIAVKLGLITTDSTLSNGQAVTLCDGSSNFKCGGSGAACGSYTFTQCASHTAYGCSQNVTGQCSDFNGDQSTCSSHSSDGCSPAFSACSTLDNDSTQCTGHSCTFTPPTCSSFYSQNDPSSCNAQPGCSANTSAACSVFDGDSSGCTSNSGCSYDFGNDTCSGNYYSSCDGFYSGGNGACTGSPFFNGTCNGSTFGTCTGSGTCSNLTGSGQGVCEASSCTWASNILLTLPAISGSTAVAGDGKTGWMTKIKDVGTSGTVTIHPTSPDTIEGGGDITLSSQYDWKQLFPYRHQASCAPYNSDQSTCEAHSGCGFSQSNCSNFNDETSCNNQSPCSWDGMQCNGVYNKLCSGTFTDTTTWLKFGSN